MPDTIYAVWLSLKLAPGAKANDRLLFYFEDNYEALYNANEEEYRKALADAEAEDNEESEGIRFSFSGKMSDKAKNALIESLSDKSLNEAGRIIEYCQRYNIGIISLNSKLYPKRLKSIPRRPIILYYRGRFPDFDRNVCVATVGTRRITEYGRKNAYTISYDLAKAGVIIVSGLARGNDGVCHRAALDADGFTVAVLGCGVDIVYPFENTNLMNEIVFKGLVISEFTPGTRPKGYYFPIRNRIISGISCGTLIVEADEKSGAMITARYAQMQGRDLFAVPGNIGEIGSRGTNMLIKEGARMAMTAMDIITAYIKPYKDVLFPGKITSVKNTLIVAQPTIKTRLNPEYETVAVQDAKEESQAENSEFRAYKKSEKSKRNEDTASAAGKRKEEKLHLKSSFDKTAAVNALSETEKAIYDKIPDDKGITSDELASLGFSLTDILISLTTLEIKALIDALPGGQYIKR